MDLMKPALNVMKIIALHVYGEQQHGDYCDYVESVSQTVALHLVL